MRKIATPIPITKISLVKEWKDRALIDYDNHVAICGDEGSGKTGLQIQFVLKFDGTSIDKSIVFTNNKKEFEYKYDLMERGSAMGFDEALRIFLRTEWFKTDQREMIHVMRSDARKEKTATFFYCAQNQRDFHPYLRIHRLRYHIEMGDRYDYNNANICFVYKKQRIPFQTGKRETWGEDFMEKLFKERMERVGLLNAEEYNNLMRNSKLYIGEFMATDLSLEKWEEYYRLRQKALDEWGGVVPDKRQITMNQRDESWLMLDEEGVPHHNIAVRCNVNRTTVTRAILRKKEDNKLIVTVT